MTYQFQGSLYRNSASMHGAIAREWLSGGGANGRAVILEFLFAYTDEALASEAQNGWNLSKNPEFNANQLAAAFAEIRADLNAAFPADADD